VKLSGLFRSESNTYRVWIRWNFSVGEGDNGVSVVVRP